MPKGGDTKLKWVHICFKDKDLPFTVMEANKNLQFCHPVYFCSQHTSHAASYFASGVRNAENTIQQKTDWEQMLTKVPTITRKVVVIPRPPKPNTKIASSEFASLDRG